MRMAVHKRKVFYLSGFDPRGARHYHQLCQEAARTYDAEVTPRTAEGWQIRKDATTTDYRFLSWDDIVRRAWVRQPLTLVWRALRMYATYARHLQWRDTFALPQAPLITLLYPLAFMVLLPVVLFGLGAWLMPWPLALAMAALLSVAALQLSKGLWLLRFFVFNHRAASDHELDARLDRFAQEIHASFSEPYDEILLLAHSNGSILSVPLMEKLSALGGWPEHFRLVTLGQCIPLVSLLRSAVGFRQQLAQLATRRFYWCDIGFPPDGAAYGRTNTFAPLQSGPDVTLKLLSPRFFQYYEPARYQRLRRNKYQLHFAYLHTGDHHSPIDFMALVAGPHSLPESVQLYEAA